MGDLADYWQEYATHSPGGFAALTMAGMYTIRGSVMPDGTMRITASEWTGTGRYPVVAFEADWRLPENCRSRRDRLRFIARASEEFLEGADLFQL